MVLIRFFVNLWKDLWSLLGTLKIDGVSWTTIMIAFVIFMVIVSGLLNLRK